MHKTYKKYYYTKRNQKEFSISAKIYENIEKKSGETVKIAFFHGLGGAKNSFDELCDNLAKKLFSKNVSHKFVVFDLLGHGESSISSKIEDYNPKNQSKIFLEILKKEFGESEKFSIFGHCFGSFVAIELASRTKDKIKNLYLVSTSPFSNSGKILKPILGKKSFFIKNFPRAFFGILGERREFFELDYSKFKKTSDLSLKRILADIKTTSLKPYLSSFLSINIESLQNSLESFLRKNKERVFVFHGEKDKIFSFEKVKKFFQERGVKIFKIENEGHLPVLNSVEYLSEEISNLEAPS